MGGVARPIWQPARRIPLSLIEEVNGLCDEMLGDKAIKGRSLRLCVDYGKLNWITKRDAYPPSSLHDSLDSLHGLKRLFKLDLKSNCWILRSEKEFTKFRRRYLAMQCSTHFLTPHTNVNGSEVDSRRHRRCRFESKPRDIKVCTMISRHFGIYCLIRRNDGCWRRLTMQVRTWPTPANQKTFQCVDGFAKIVSPLQKFRDSRQKGVVSERKRTMKQLKMNKWF